MNEIVTCGARGETHGLPVPHTCSCGREAGHPSDGSTPVALHTCLCGESWPGAEPPAFELTDAERRTVDEFLRAADYSGRMAASSIDIDGRLVARVAALLRRVREPGEAA